MSTPLEYKLTALIEPLLNADNIDLVQLSMIGEGHGTILQILAEDRDTQTLDLDTCTRLSRTIGTHLEVEDIVKSAYRLEISSPGIERPLTKPDHYKRYAGQNVKIETQLPLPSSSGTPQRRFQGKIKESTDEAVTLDDNGTLTTLEFANITKAKLKIADEIFAPTPKKGHTQKGAVKK